jgi:hypothetical protein
MFDVGLQRLSQLQFELAFTNSYFRREAAPHFLTVETLLQYVYGLPNKSIYISPAENIWLTHVPSRIFGTNPLYTVTSSLAVEDLAQGKTIIPPAFHGNTETRTHRGIGLQFLNHMFFALGMENGTKDYLIWLGNGNADAEQFLIEDTIAKTGTAVDDQLKELVFVRKPNDFLYPHPKLREVLRSVYRGRSLNQRQQAYVDELLTALYRNTGIREGWYTTLEAILNGEQGSGVERDYIAIRNILSYSERQLMSVPKPSQAVILEVDPRQLFYSADRPVMYPVVPGRDPRQIVSAPYIQSSDITRVFTSDPERLRYDLNGNKGMYDIRPVEEFPIENWLGGITPAQVQNMTRSRYVPVCSMRYELKPNEQTAAQLWVEHLNRGLLVPLHTYDGRSPITYLHKLLQEFGDEVITDDPLNRGFSSHRKEIVQELNSDFRLPGLIQVPVK